MSALRLSRRLAPASRCPYCHDDVGAAEGVECGRCGAAQHAECARLLGRCANACSGALVARGSVGPSLPRVASSLPASAVLAALAFSVVVCAWVHSAFARYDAFAPGSEAPNVATAATVCAIGLLVVTSPVTIALAVLLERGIAWGLQGFRGAGTSGVSTASPAPTP